MENQTSNYQPLTVKQWLGSLLLIQLFGIIPLLIFAFSSETHPSKKNYAKATLLLMLIVMGIMLVLGLIYFIFAIFMFGGTTIMMESM